MARLRDPQRRLPVGPRADLRHHRAVHDRGSLRGRRRHRARRSGQLRDELGDLLFQVVFHARMAEERGWFDFAAVARAIHDKLVRRHPHVFAGAALATPRSWCAVWEEQKAQERAAAAPVTHGAVQRAGRMCRRALPALTRAAKLGRRAARVGFDWPEAAEVRAKVLEELREVDAAQADAGDRPPRRARWPRSSAICCSPWSTGRAIWVLMRRRRCARPMASSSDASRAWRRSPLSVRSRSRSCRRRVGCAVARGQN